MVRGRYCERLVKEHYENLGHTTVAEKFRSHFAEIDLVFYKKQMGITLVEVKSMRFEPVFSPVVSRRQLGRLSRALVDFQQTMPCSVGLHIIGVGVDDALTIWDENIF